MSSPVNSIGNVTAADLVRYASPTSPAAGNSFEAVISDRGVDEAAAAGKTAQPARVESVPPAAVSRPNPVSSVEQAGASESTAAVDGTYNARGRLALQAQEAPQSRLLDIVG